MDILNTFSLESNKQLKINFDGGELSSDAALLLLKESKSPFSMDSMSRHSMTINSNKLQFSMLAYNLFNSFRRLVLPEQFKKFRVDTIRLKLLKIAAKAVNFFFKRLCYYNF